MQFGHHDITHHDEICCANDIMTAAIKKIRHRLESSQKITPSDTKIVSERDLFEGFRSKLASETRKFAPFSTLENLRAPPKKTPRSAKENGSLGAL